jgi:glyoxalase family protein
MSGELAGIHHITAIAGDPQRNLDFYTGLLGLRLVKLTVNFDDPESYHLYYGDALGRPGSILTFFAWPGARAGHEGAGQINQIALSMPPDTLAFWRARLQRAEVAAEETTTGFDERALTFRDPDGLALMLVAAQGDSRPAWETGPVPAQSAIRGTYAVTLWEEQPAVTAHLLTETMGLRLLARAGDVARYAFGSGAPGALVDVRAAAGTPRGQVAVGSVHHVAWRTPDDAEQLEWRAKLLAQGAHVSPVMDRDYFHSIYYREPGGVLFEIATEPPGFATDETPETLGTGLKLPAWLEPQRRAIERGLPPLRLPGVMA